MTLVTFLTNSMSYKLVKDSYAPHLTELLRFFQVQESYHNSLKVNFFRAAF